MSDMLAVSFGGGTNSTALLVGLKERGITPDVIFFSDTGSEKPHTYEHLDIIDLWLESIGFPPLVRLKKGGRQETLEEECLRLKCLPSIAYGFKTCSQKYKIAPADVYFNNLPEAKALWAGGGLIKKAVGFDADEPQRAKQYDSDKFVNWYPLIEDWDWGREECIDAINREGLPLPGKSACFFCPSSKTTEVKWLAAKHPDLMDRAIAIEKNADLTSVKGLGRSYKWEDVIATDDMFSDNFIELSCGCYDG